MSLNSEPSSAKNEKKLPNIPEQRCAIKSPPGRVLHNLFKRKKPVSVEMLVDAVNHNISTAENLLTDTEVKNALAYLSDEKNFVTKKVNLDGGEDLWAITTQGKTFHRKSFAFYTEDTHEHLIDKNLSPGRPREKPMSLVQVKDGKVEVRTPPASRKTPVFKKRKKVLSPLPLVEEAREPAKVRRTAHRGVRRVREETPAPTPVPAPEPAVNLDAEVFELNDVAHAMRFDMPIPACSANKTRGEHVRQLDAVGLIELYGNVSKAMVLLRKACSLHSPQK